MSSGVGGLLNCKKKLIHNLGNKYQIIIIFPSFALASGTTEERLPSILLGSLSGVHEQSHNLIL